MHVYMYSEFFNIYHELVIKIFEIENFFGVQKCVTIHT